MVTSIFVPDTRERRNQLLALLGTAYPGISDPYLLGGTWVVRQYGGGALAACIWVAMDQPFAYLDYLCSYGEGHGLRLASQVVINLTEAGYTRILANVHQENTLMMRAMEKLLGQEGIANGPYCLVDLSRR